MNPKITGDEQIVTTVYKQISDNDSRVATEKDIQAGLYLHTEMGLTKRNFFAALAMQGVLASGYGNDYGIRDVAAMSVGYADALIEELNKEK